MAAVDDQTPQRHGWGKVKLTVMNPDTGSEEDTSTRHSNKHATGKPSTRTPPTPSPPYPGPANPPSKPHTTHNLAIAETSDNPKPSRRGDSLPSAQQTLSPARQMLSPAVLSSSDHIVVAVTHDAENYVSVDLSGYTEAQAIRENILSKLDIPDNLHFTFSIYQTELHGYAIGGALDDTQLLIKCQLFGDHKGSLKFLVQPTDITPTSAGVVGVFPPLRVDSPARIRQSGEARPGRPSGPVRQSDSQRQSQDLVVSPPQQHPTRQQPSLRPLPPVPQYPAHSQAQITHSQSSDPRERPTPPPQQLEDPPTYTPEQGRLPSGDQRVPGDQWMMGGQLITDDQTATLGEGGMTELVEAPSLAPPGSASAPPVSQQTIPPPTQPLRATTDIPSQHFAVQEQDDNYRDLDGRAFEGTSGRAASFAAGTIALPARQSASNPKELRPPVGGTSLLSGADSSSGPTLPLEARHDSDRLASNARLGGDAPKALPVAEKPAVQGAGRQKKSLRMMAVEREKALQRRTIRRVHKKDVSSDSDSDSVPTAVYFTRRNAKVWGGRVKKATPSGMLGVDLSAQDPGTISDGPRKQGGWRLKRAKAQRLGSADDAERDVETDDPTSNTRTIVMIQSGQISCEEMFQHLVAHGCKDLSSDMDPEKYSSGMIIGGAFGDIWKGKLRDGREVAIKVWRFTSLLHNGTKSMKRAMREIYYWSKIKNEYVQELMGVIMFQGRLGMVSLWMGNGNLREYIYKNPSVDRYSLCYQVASGIAYLHSQDMVHGDLKGVNILVSPSGDAKLSDFDHTIMSECTLVFSETSRLGGGTTRWMAPELILDDDCRRSAYTDVYALGMTMLEIITNTSPYYPQCKEDVNVIMTVMKRQLPVRPTELLGDNPRDNRMWELLLRCWDYDPLARPKAAEVVEWLQGIIALPTISGQV